jgi:hypothetical protein
MKGGSGRVGRLQKNTKAVATGPSFDSIDDVIALIERCSNIIVIAGAGISVSCGLVFSFEVLSSLVHAA